MFEGLVRPLLLGYLGRYIKDIQNEQLKITLWNEEVLLENVELILEAFDYLQLPFALKHGRVGKLSIKIPWKKLGWDPIIIVLEDVFISACQRADKEWSKDAVEAREFAGKRAKLAAAELAKLSRRVCDNRAGKSFISHITAKILDGIQVSIRNVHVLYCDMVNASAVAVFGMKFSGLTISRQNLIGFSSGKLRGGQVNKLVEVQSLELYCSTFKGTLDLGNIENTLDSKYEGNSRFEGDKCEHVLSPLDLLISLSVNRSGKLDNDAPQYSVNVELNSVAVTVDEVQLQRILSLSDYISTCCLRERYGRYHPWWSPLEKKLEGWQTDWWHYAQESVLSDVRKRLQRTSWKYFGERLNRRRKYVNLYKSKLKCLQQDQVIDEDVLWELEEIEKVSDIDDILNYRSVAERELQDLLINSSVNRGSNGASGDKSLEDERAPSKPRGWLNWLSHGMLGAGGTDDSREFSGVVSDDIIKDIYEATKFHPVQSLNEDDAATNDEIFLSTVKFNIRQISVILRSKRLGSAIAHWVFDGTSVECKIWEKSAIIIATIISAELFNPFNKKVILSTRKINNEENNVEVLQPSLAIQVDVLPSFQEARLSLKVVVQPTQMTWESRFLTDIVEFFRIFGSFRFQHERVLSSVNEIDDVQTRILSKIDYVLSRRQRMVWDVNFVNIVIVLPWADGNFNEHKLVLEVGAFNFQSKDKNVSFASDSQDPSYSYSRDHMSSSLTNGFIRGFQLEDLYDGYEINISDFEVKISRPCSSEMIPIFEKFGSSIRINSCIISDESILKALDVYMSIPSLHVHCAPSVYGSIMGLLENFSKLQSKSSSEDLNTTGVLNVQSNGVRASEVFWFSVKANLESVGFEVDLENDVENGYFLMLFLQMLDVSFDLKELPECWMSLEVLKIIAYSEKKDGANYILCSSGPVGAAECSGQQEKDIKHSKQRDNLFGGSSSFDRCLKLHYEAFKDPELICHKFAVCLADFDINCYPFIVGPVIGFIDKIMKYETSISADDFQMMNVKSSLSRPHFDFQLFGVSNFFETGASDWANIPLDRFPFVTIYNSGPLVAPQNSLVYDIPQWRKILNLRVQKIESHKFSLKKESRSYDTQLLQSEPIVDLFLEDAGAKKMFSADLNLSSIRLHFHDSSCLVGTLSFPICRSSFSICDDRFDVLCSSEGLVLSSSWWCQTMDGFLWGPSSPNLSPILNIRVRKELTGSMELSFGIQHVSCTLYPDFLAVIIGYFSSPEWSFKAEDVPLCNTEDKLANPNKPDYGNSEENPSISYKFEILESILMAPFGGDGCQFMKLDMPQLLCGLIENSDINTVFKDIPIECSIPADKLCSNNHSLNLFGRDLLLSLLLVKGDQFDSSSFHEIPQCQNVTLIAPLSADVWVSFPIQCECSNIPSSCPTGIMATVIDCHLDVRGPLTIAGFEALGNVVNQFSLVDRASKLFKSDFLEFLQSKRRLEEDAKLPLEDLAVSATEIRLWVQSMSMGLHCERRESSVSELFAEFEMQLTCSASLKNDTPLYVDISFHYLTLFSLLNSVMLVEGSFSNSSSSSPNMNLSLLDQNKNKLLISFPCLEIWLHIFDWSEVIVLFEYYYVQKSERSPGASSKNIEPVENVAIDMPQCSTEFLRSSSSFPHENLTGGTSCSVVKLEGVNITTHVPIQFSGDVFSILEKCQVQNKKHVNDSCDMSYGNHPGFVVLSWQSRYSEIINDGKTVIVKIILETVGGTVQLYMDSIPRTWPLFQLFHINLEAKISNHHQEHMHAEIEVYVDNLDIGLSNDIFYLYQCIWFGTPEAGMSQLMISSIDFRVQLGKFSLLLTDGQWSSCRPLLEILMRNLLLYFTITDHEMEGSIGSDLQANYNNIDKVLWEPLVEPWTFKLSMSRKHDSSSLLKGAVMTHVHLKSTSQLNLNLTESVIEIASRAIEMIGDIWRPPEMASHSSSQKLFNSQMRQNLDTGTYAPYILQNLTSLPLIFHVFEGEPSADDLNALSSRRGNFLQPGSSVPVYVDETPEKQILGSRPTKTFERLIGKQIFEAAHCFIIIQLEGTSVPSAPISMDLVGLRYFDVDFSKPIGKSVIGNSGDALKSNKNLQGEDKTELKTGFIIPVVIDVSVQRYTKILRLYSTVIFSNATPVPLEVRFDIPFGVAPKILDPIYPGKEFPLPLHLAETGRIRWRPLGDSYLWSEAYNVSNIISQESRTCLPRSFICYPSHPSSDPFRCCMSVDDRRLCTVGRIRKNFPDDDGLKQSIRSSKELSQGREVSKKQFIHLVTFTSPLIFKNYLPEAISVAIENGSVTRTALLSKVETSFFHVDSSHDLTLTFTIGRFRPSILKFSRAEIFSSMAKFSGTKFSLSESLTFDSELEDGPLCVTMEKVMDAFSGAREICISVPFLIYNCVSFPLFVSNSVDEIEGHCCTVPSCYNLEGHDQILGGKDGLSHLFSIKDIREASIDTHLTQGSLRNPSIPKPNDYKFSGTPLNPFDAPRVCHQYLDKDGLDAQRSTIPTLNSETSRNLTRWMSNANSPDFLDIDCKKVKPCMYSPFQNSSSQIMVRLSRCIPNGVTKSGLSSLWSSPFSLVPSTGSTSVIVPQLRANAGDLVSVSAVAAPFSGRTKMITFQPRYVISNICSRDLFYKQKGTDLVLPLETGRHSHIQCADTTRDLLVCIRFHELGWEWSGCFSPEHLGDTQVKMRNYISGAVNMMRVEVQSADISVNDEKIVGSPHGNSGTNLILVSDDDTGFMPYRVDNFSKERLRIYQQRCENFETMVHSYTSHCYAWDEPCFPHRLTVEVPGERVIGSYSLDDVKDYSPVYLPATCEKPERKLLVSVHSEGAIKVLSIIDSNYHVPHNLSTSDASDIKHRRKLAEKCDSYASVYYNERILVDIPFIGISLMNNYPEELLFACAKNTRFDLVQSLEQQKLCLHISFLQIDNQLPSTPYPVILSFEHSSKSNHVDRRKMRNIMQIDSDGLHEPVFSLAVAKWRSKNLSLVSLEYINLRVTDFHLELEQEVILSLFEFFKTMSLRLQSSKLRYMDSTLHPPSLDPPFVMDTSTYIGANEFVESNWNQQYSINIILLHEDCRNSSLLPPVIPIGAPWQQIHPLARKQKKIYVELLDLAPIKFTLSFSSSPWMLRNGVLTSGESLIHRGLMALADVEGAQIHLKELVLSHQLASWESIQEIFIRHYTRQSLHEMYKVFGSAGLIGNPMGFARSVSLGIKDFLSVPVRSVFQSPVGLLTGISRGTTSLLSNTVYAISDAASQFSRAAHKGIVAFALDGQNVGQLEKQQKGIPSQSKGVINEFLEGLTGLLQSPVQGAEKHGLPGVLSGIAMGVTGFVAKPAASILEVTGKTALSIRNRSKLPHMGSQRFRVRLPRPLSREFPLKPYSWEEAIGTSVLRDANDGVKLRDESLVSCKALRQAGKFVIITEKLILVVSCASLVDLGNPKFQGVPANPEWVIESEIGMDSVIIATSDEDAVHIVGSSSDIFFRHSQQQKQGRGGSGKWWNPRTPLPLFQTNLEFAHKEEAVDVLRLILSLIARGKDQGWGRLNLLHQSNLR